MVELTEDGELAELGDTREKDEAQVLVARLERGVELAHHLTEAVEKNLVVDDIEQGHIVLVDQDNDAGGIARSGMADEGVQAPAKRLGQAFATGKRLLDSSKQIIKPRPEPLDTRGLHHAHVEPDDRARLPLSPEPPESKAVEELAAALKVGLHGREKQRLPKAAGGARERMPCRPSA